MKSLLFVAVCLTLALVTSAADSLNDELLRTLAKLDSSSDQSHNRNPYEKRVVSGDNSQVGGETGGSVESGNNSNPPEEYYMGFPEFKSRVHGWAQKSKAFVQAFDAMKPDALLIMTGKKEWEDIEGNTAAVIGQGFHTYGEIAKEVFDTWGRLFVQAKGFKETGRCRQVDRLASDIDVERDDMAGIKSFEALVSDMDCFAGEFRDTFSVLEDACIKEDTFSPDHAMDILTNVMKTLFRLKRDGERFAPAAAHIKAELENEKAKKTPTPTITDDADLLKRILRKLQD